MNEAEYDVRIMTSHQFGIYKLVSQMSCRGEETGNQYWRQEMSAAIIRNATIHGFYNISVLKKYIFMYIHTDCYVTLQLHIIRDLKIRRP